MMELGWGRGEGCLKLGEGKNELFSKELQMDGRPPKDGCDQLLYAEGGTEEVVGAPLRLSGVHG